MILQKNDTIGIAATARHIDEATIANTVRLLESWGLKVKLSSALFERDNAFAGNDASRAKAFNELLLDGEVKAILLARGGYGTIRIIDDIDFSGFAENPKLIIGFSDVTVIHAHINKHYPTPTLHACMPITMQGDYYNETTISSLQNALFNNKINYTFAKHPLNRNGNVEAKLVGGNLSVLYSLLASDSLVSFDDCILFIEDIGEYYYHIDRMMIALKRAGKLAKLKGLLVGGMSSMNENAPPFEFNKDCYQIISETVAEYNYPVYFSFPAGHEALNVAIRLGSLCTLRSDATQVYFEQ
ncbi:MAG: LD-carboxypeptidase [Bacteroidota bacterium]